MIRSLLIIVLIGGTSLVYTDIDSPSVFYSRVLPPTLLLALMAPAVWFVLLFHRLGVTQIANSSGGEPGGFGDPDGGGGSDDGR
jgi:hypothetical protein